MYWNRKSTAEKRMLVVLLVGTVVWIASGCGTDQPSSTLQPPGRGGRGVVGDDREYLLNVAIDASALRDLLASGSCVALAKNAMADSSSYALIWASFTPQAQNTVAWDDAYGVCAATSAPQPGATLNVFASAAAEPNVLYAFGRAGGGCGFTASGPAGQTPDQYVLQYADFCQQPRQMQTLGLTQALSVNQATLGPNTLLAASTLFQQTLTITKTENVQVFVLPSANAATGTVLGSLPTGSLLVQFDEINNTRSIRYDAASQAFVADDPAPVISYGSRSYTFTKGVGIQPVVPSNTGGEMLTWSIFPALPAGLSLGSATGILSGTPSEIKPLAPYTVTARNTGGASMAVVSIAVNDLPPCVSYSNSAPTFAPGVPIPPLVPTNSGGAALGWSVRPALPPGLVFSTVTGAISGTPSAVAPAAHYTVAARNSGGSATADLLITVQPPPPVILAQPASQLVAAGASAVFRVQASGTGALSYQWLKDGAPIAGATSASCTTPPAVLADSGAVFRVVVSDAYGGNVTSAGATLTISNAPRFAFVSGTSGVYSYRVDAASGRLAYISRVATASWPYGIAVDPSGRYAYAADAHTDQVAQYTIETDGRLTPMEIPLVEAGANPQSIAVDASGSYAYVANFDSNDISQYAIGEEGGLSEIGTGPVAAGVQPMAVAVDPWGTHAYVANFGSDDVSQYAIGADGVLVPMDTAAVSAGNGPHAITFDPTGTHAYVANSGSGTVSQYTVGPDGSLTALPVPAVRCGVLPCAVAVHPGGRYAYTANSGSGNLSQFTVGADGSLAAMAVASVAAGGGPQSVTIDPSGSYLYAANQADGTVSQYAILADGRLAPLSPAARITGPYPLAMAMSGGGPGLTPVSRAYVADYVGNQVLPYAIGEDGSLSPLAAPSVEAGQGPNCIAVDPSSRYAYTANWRSNSVSQYAIGEDGSLSALATPAVSAGLAPTFVTVGPWGEHVYVTNQNSHTVSQYTIGPDGGLLPMTPPEVASDVSPTWIAIDPSGRYAYVTNYNSADVSQYAIGEDGGLTPMTPATVPCSGSPSAVAVDLSGRYAYVASSGGHGASVVAQYSIGADGRLSPLAAAPTVPAGSSPNSIDIDPSGRYAYATDFIGSAVLQYSIAATGALVPMPTATVPAGRYPEASAFDPSGRCLYVANEGDGSIAQYRIGGGGLLTPMSTPSVAGGSAPNFIAIVGFWR